MIQKERKKKAAVAILISDKIDFTTKPTTRDKGDTINSASVYSHLETQNNNLKRHMHVYAHCSIIYDGQYMEAT